MVETWISAEDREAMRENAEIALEDGDSQDLFNAARNVLRLLGEVEKLQRANYDKAQEVISGLNKTTIKPLRERVLELSMQLGEFEAMRDVFMEYPELVLRYTGWKWRDVMLDLISRSGK